LRRHQIEAVVFQLMDDTIFISLTEEGEKIPPRKEGEIVHIEGDLSIIDNAVLSKLLKLCKPLLTATVGIKTVWVGPLPQYVTGSRGATWTRCYPTWRRCTSAPGTSSSWRGCGTRG
jgi:hypothetical protein